MTSISQQTQKEHRPWYLSVTMLWHELDGFNKYQQAIRRTIGEDPRLRKLPFHHCEVKKTSLHSTIFAILEINLILCSSESSAEELSKEVFREFFKNKDLKKDISKILNCFALEVTPKEIRCYDNNTTIQFCDIPNLEETRTQLRSILQPHVRRVIDLYPSAKSLLSDESKSKGARLFGSIARSPCRSDTSFLRWKCSICSPPLRCEKIHLLVSDDALTNYRDDQNDIPIDLKVNVNKKTTKSS